MNAEQLYRKLLKFYPPTYRREYEEAMAQCFRDQLRDAPSRRQRIRLWGRTITDLALTIPVRHLERIVPAPHHPAPHHRFSGYQTAAKRAVFFAQYEAASFGGAQIKLEHLLLGILRGDRKLATATVGREGVREIVRTVEAREAHPRRRPNGKDLALPFSPDCENVLREAQQQARHSGGKVTAHRLLSAILGQNKSEVAQLLREYVIRWPGVSPADEQ